MRNKLSKSPSKIVLYFSPALYTYNFKTKKRYKSGFYLLTCFEVLNVNSTTFATKNNASLKMIFTSWYSFVFLLVAQTEKKDISFSQIHKICF